MKRRRVFRVIALYAIAGWIVIEVASTVLPGLNLPDWTSTLVIVLVALGFPIAVVMAWAFDLGPDGVTRTPAVETEPAPAAPGAQSPEPAPQPASEPDKVTPPVSTPVDEHSIAVLPFVNMSGDVENEYFSDGIAEEILNLLVKLPRLKVASRTSSFVFKGKEVNIPTVASELGVATVLEGSVRQAGGRVRITAQLIDAVSDKHLWSETYDREFKDVFAIQDDIAQSIVDALQMTLTPKERRSIQFVATSDAKAYDHYLIDKSAAKIIETARRSGADVRGPVPLPARIHRVTVNRSPHVDKKARDQFEIRSHKRIIDILEPTQQTIDDLGKLELSAGIDVELKLQ